MLCIDIGNWIAHTHDDSLTDKQKKRKISNYDCQLIEDPLAVTVQEYYTDEYDDGYRVVEEVGYRSVVHWGMIDTFLFIVGHYFFFGIEGDGIPWDVKQLKKIIGDRRSAKVEKILQDNLDKWGDNEDWESMACYDLWSVQKAVFDQNQCLNILSRSSYPNMRALVASRGLFLENYLNDINPAVRIAVVKQEYGLEHYLKDIEPSVRAAVAEQRYGLDQLVKDQSYLVREAVARQGYGHNILVFDEAWQVREAVAQNCLNMDILERLFDDPSDKVLLSLVRHCTNLPTLCQDKRLEKLAYHKNSNVRVRLAAHGIALDVLKNDEHEQVRNRVQRYLADAEKLARKNLAQSKV